METARSSGELIGNKRLKANGFIAQNPVLILPRLSHFALRLLGEKPVGGEEIFGAGLMSTSYTCYVGNAP